MPSEPQTGSILSLHILKQKKINLSKSLFKTSSTIEKRKRNYIDMQINFCVTCSAGAFSPIAVVCVENTIRAADRFNIIIAYTWAGQRTPP